MVDSAIRSRCSAEASSHRCSIIRDGELSNLVGGLYALWLHKAGSKFRFWQLIFTWKSEYFFTHQTKSKSPYQ